MQSLVDLAPQTGIADLQTQFLDYAGHVDGLWSPEEVLDELHAVTTSHLPLAVLVAIRLPKKSGDWDAIQMGKTAFLHDSVPKGWWDEHDAFGSSKFRPALFLAGHIPGLKSCN